MASTPSRFGALSNARASSLQQSEAIQYVRAMEAFPHSSLSLQDLQGGICEEDLAATQRASGHPMSLTVKFPCAVSIVPLLVVIGSGALQTAPLLKVHQHQHMWCEYRIIVFSCLVRSSEIMIDTSILIVHIHPLLLEYNFYPNLRMRRK